MIELIMPRRCFICQAECGVFCCPDCSSDLPWVPHHCVHCHRAVPHRQAACKSCLIIPSTHLYSVPLLYQSPLPRVFSAFKLHQQEQLCLPLAHLFVSWFSSFKPDVLIPVPSHPKRIWERGYNPAFLIARQLGAALHIPVDDRAVRRIRHSAPQRLQTKQGRAENLTDAFEVVRLKKGLRIALVDDVVTTGQTLRELAKVVEPFALTIEYWAIAESPHLDIK